MEVTSTKPKRLFRNEAQIRELLASYAASGLSIKSFCQANGIPNGSFHNWQKKYGAHQKSSGFTSVSIATTAAVLFAEVNGIRLYQPVSTTYLKELLP